MKKWNIEGHEGVAWVMIETHRDEKKSEGILVEQHGGRPVGQTIYVWYHTENELVIDRSDLEPDGFMWICYEERLRVECVEGGTLRLHALLPRTVVADVDPQ